MLEGHVFSLNGLTNYPWITNGKKVMWQKQPPPPRFVYLVLAPPPTWIFNLLIEIWSSKTGVFQDQTLDRVVRTRDPRNKSGQSQKIEKSRTGTKRLLEWENIFKKLSGQQKYLTVCGSLGRKWDEMRTNRCAQGSLVVFVESILIETDFEKGQIFECLAKNFWF